MLRKGSVLVEAMVALVILSVASIMILKGSMNILAPRQWTLFQNISDAYLTYEKSYAERIPFEEMTATGTPWPLYPANAESTVSMGTLPGGGSVSATLKRTRIADPNNLPAFGGSGTIQSNPAELQVWKLQSHLIYTMRGREYVKSRTIVRTQ